jgi:hypothetical protein
MTVDTIMKVNKFAATCKMRNLKCIFMMNDTTNTLNTLRWETIINKAKCIMLPDKLM